MRAAETDFGAIDFGEEMGDAQAASIPGSLGPASEEFPLKVRL